MTNIFIPQAWTVGIAEIDQEHQALIQMLFDNEYDNATQYFDEFYRRYSALLAEREKHMETVGHFNKERSLDDHKRTLTLLRKIYKDAPHNCLEFCRSSLLKEISDAELYYHNPYNIRSKIA